MPGYKSPLTAEEGMTGVGQALKTAKANADTEYAAWLEKRTKEASDWATLGYGKQAAPGVSQIVSLVKGNWGQIATVGAAFGLPLGVADTGAFASILGVLGNFWPF